MAGDLIKANFTGGMFSVEFNLTGVDPAVAWMFGWVYPDHVRDACWDGEAIR